MSVATAPLTAASAPDANAMRATVRVRYALAVALLTGAFTLLRTYFHPTWSTDLDQFWYACRAMFAGNDPYDAVGPGKTFDWTWPLFYPLPALLIASPLALVSLAAARILFSALGGFVVGYAIAPQWTRRWPLLLSMAFFAAISRNQWSPYVLASAWIPIAGAIVVVKPNVGLITLAVQRRRALVLSLGVSALLVVASFVVRPHWLGTWLQLVRHAPNKEISLLQPFGFLLVLTLLAWRTTEGRVLAAMSVIPHTPSLYDLLPVFLTATTTRDTVVLAALTHVLHWSVLAFGPYTSRDAAFLSVAHWEVILVLLPALALILWRQFKSRNEAALIQGSTLDDGRHEFGIVERVLIVLCAVSLGIQLWIVALT